MGLLLIGLGVLLLWLGVRLQKPLMRYAGFLSLAAFVLLLVIAWPIGGTTARIH